MTDITLSSEQIRNAPTIVRQWIERELGRTLGFSAMSDSGAPAPQLAACDTAELTQILANIRGVLPAVNVLFELGREGIDLTPDHLEAFRLADIMHNTQLQNIEAVVGCLDLITQALRHVRNDPNVMFCGFDDQGHCFIPLQTQQNIVHLWREMIGGQRISTRTPPALQPSVPDGNQAPSIDGASMPGPDSRLASSHPTANF